MTSESRQPEYLSIAGAARHISVSIDTIRRRIASGQIPAYDISEPDSPKRTIRVRRVDIESLLRPVL